MVRIGSVALVLVILSAGVVVLLRDVSREARTNQARAYRPHLAPSARLHRPNLLPVVGDRRILQWLATQPAFTEIDTRFTEAARSGDLGYTWGNYATKAARGGGVQRGFYVRVWVRERNGQWKVALDVLQPQ